MSKKTIIYNAREVTVEDVRVLDHLAGRLRDARHIIGQVEFEYGRQTAEGIAYSLVEAPHHCKDWMFQGRCAICGYDPDDTDWYVPF